MGKQAFELDHRVQQQQGGVLLTVSMGSQRMEELWLHA